MNGTGRYATAARRVSETEPAEPYLLPRLLPRGEAIPSATVHIVTAGDRLDLIAARALGDPTFYWQIADANDAMNPFDLCREPGTRLRLPLPQGGPEPENLSGLSRLDDLGTTTPDAPRRARGAGR